MEQFAKHVKRWIIAKPRRRHTKGARTQAELLTELRRQETTD